MLKAERDWELPRIGELPMPAGGLCAPSALQMVFGAMNLRRCPGPGVWTFRMGQPGGLAAGSRWSPKGVGAATTGSRRRNNHAPWRGARPATTAYMFADVANLEVAAVSKRLFWHPSGVRELKTSFPVVVPPLSPNDHRLPSGNPPGWRACRLWASGPNSRPRALPWAGMNDALGVSIGGSCSRL